MSACYDVAGDEGGSAAGEGASASGPAGPTASEGDSGAGEESWAGGVAAGRTAGPFHESPPEGPEPLVEGGDLLHQGINRPGHRVRRPLTRPTHLLEAERQKLGHGLVETGGQDPEPVEHLGRSLL